MTPFPSTPSGPIPKPGVRKRPKAKALLPESDLQARAENLCLSLGIRFFRIPDKLQGFLAHYAPPWVRVFVARYFAGVPDLMLFRPGIKVTVKAGGEIEKQPDDNFCRFIEIKTEAGKLSQGQSKWHTGLNVIVTYGWPETEKAIRDFAA